LCRSLGTTVTRRADWTSGPTVGRAGGRPGGHRRPASAYKTSSVGTYDVDARVYTLAHTTYDRERERAYSNTICYHSFAGRFDCQSLLTESATASAAAAAVGAASSFNVAAWLSPTSHRSSNYATRAADRATRRLTSGYSDYALRSPDSTPSSKPPFVERRRRSRRFQSQRLQRRRVDDVRNWTLNYLFRAANDGRERVDRRQSAGVRWRRRRRQGHHTRSQRFDISLNECGLSVSSCKSFSSDLSPPSSRRGRTRHSLIWMSLTADCVRW